MSNDDSRVGACGELPAPDALCACVEELRRVCRDAWQEGLLSGCNGNASVRLDAGGEPGNILCMTRTGAAKGRLTAADICLVDAGTGRCLANGQASSEAAMHLALYAARPGCRAVLHTHPRRLLALSLVLAARGRKANEMLEIPFYEAGVWRARMGFAPVLPPGSQDLAAGVVSAARLLSEANAAVPPAGPGAVWMEGHGLCCFAPSLAKALTMSEELEHLAAVQLLALGAGAPGI